MPDLITHAAAAYFASRPDRYARHRAAFYLGTIIPDILSRPIYIIRAELFPYTVGIHTPVFLAAFCLLLSQFFSETIRAGICRFLLAGVGLHLLLDLLQSHLFGGYFWLFPFSWRSFEIGLFWPETLLSFAPLWIIMILLSELVIRLKKRKGKV
jgi:hypothetical protein